MVSHKRFYRQIDERLKNKTARKTIDGTISCRYCLDRYLRPYLRRYLEDNARERCNVLLVGVSEEDAEACTEFLIEDMGLERPQFVLFGFDNKRLFHLKKISGIDHLQVGPGWCSTHHTTYTKMAQMGGIRRFDLVVLRRPLIKSRYIELLRQTAYLCCYYLEKGGLFLTTLGHQSEIVTFENRILADLAQDRLIILERQRTPFIHLMEPLDQYVAIVQQPEK